MKIYVVDNGGQWTHREWRVVKSFGVEAEIVPNTVEPSRLDDADGIILSGGAPSIVDEIDKLGNIGQIISRRSRPTLGICVGAQFIALHYGGKVGPGSTPEYGRTEVRFSNNNSIFSGIGDRIIVWENHNDEVKDLPKGFVVSASSNNCKIQAFYHENDQMYGVQFHPEVNNTEKGELIFRNFIEECRK